MISNPNLIFYACIAKGGTILAEFNSKDADLATLAAKCLEKTPPLHVNFFHTVRKRTYTFLIGDPFVYFAIYDENLENAEALSFLESVQEAFVQIIDNGGSPEDKMKISHCFQGEFNPVFHQLLASPADLPSPHSLPRVVLKHDRKGSFDSPRGKKIGTLPLLGGDITKKKKKKRSGYESDNGEEDKDGSAGNKVDVPAGDAIVLSRDFSMSMQKNGLSAADDSTRHKAKRVWKRHVWVVLSLDLIVCSILFAVWVWICRGLKCIDD